MAYPRKPHCKRGHLLDGENVRFTANGKRVCRECIRRWALISYYKKTGRSISFDYEPPAPLAERFADGFIPEPNSGCWIWMRCIHKKGYGHLQFDGKLDRAHRVSWQLYRGPIPDGLHVLHHCDNPSCVNPDHLFLGTNADNIADLWTKGLGRPNKGEANGRAKLTLDAVKLIRSSEMTVASLAARFGVSISAIYRARNRANWKETT